MFFLKLLTKSNYNFQTQILHCDLGGKNKYSQAVLTLLPIKLLLILTTYLRLLKYTFKG